MRSLLAVAAVLAPSIAIAQAPPDAPAEETPAEEASPAPGRRVAMVVTPPGATPPAGPAAAAVDQGAPEEASEPLGLDRRVLGDANAGRNYFTETALTPKRGSISWSLRAPTAPLVESQLRASLHDRIEVGLGGLTILEDVGEATVLSFYGKGQIWRNDRAAVAVTAQTHSFGFGFEDHYDEGYDDDSETVIVPGVVASTCLDGDGCAALVSVSVNALVLPDEDEVPIFAGVGWALGRRFQFVGELNVSHDDEGSDTIYFGYTGVRGAGRHVAFDFGLGFAGEGDDGDVFPFLGLTTRK